MVSSIKTRMFKGSIVASLLFLCCFFCVPASAQVKIYSGKINNKYAIEMHLLTVKSRLYGYYFYKSVQKPIPLHRSKRDSTKLVEKDDLKENAYFEILEYGNTISGNWHDEKNNKCLPFSLKETGSEVLSNTARKRAGRYLMDSSVIKELSIYSIHDNIIYFEITAQSSNCVGNLNGIANVYGSTAHFSNKDCSNLFFELGDKSVVIHENGCGNVHGKHCSFEGVYIRDSKAAANYRP